MICVLPVDYISQLFVFCAQEEKNKREKELWKVQNWSRNYLHWAMFYANNRQYDNTK